MVRHPNITGVLERPMLKSSIIHIKKIKPIKKVLFISDAGATSQVVKAEMYTGKDTLTLVGGIAVDIKLIAELDDWKQTIINAKTNLYDVIILGLYHTLIDNNKKHVSEDAVISWTSENTPVPLFGSWAFSVGAGKAIGGYVMFGREQGLVAAKIAQLILFGKSPGSIRPKIAEKGRFLFSKSQLKKWGLTLPAHIAFKTIYTD